MFLLIALSIALVFSLLIVWVSCSLNNANGPCVTDFSFVSFNTIIKLIDDGDIFVDKEGYFYVLDPLASTYKNRWALVMDPITFYWFVFTQEKKFNKKLVAPWKRKNNLNDDE